MHSLVTNRWFNALWFQGIWFMAVLGQQQWLWPMAATLSLHFALINKRLPELWSVLAISLLGILSDSILTHTGVFAFSSAMLPIPLWLMGLWVGFAVSLHHSLSFLQQQPWLAALLGGIGGTCSYYAGMRLGAVDFPLGLIPTLLILFPLWSVLTPSCCYLISRLNRHHSEMHP